MQGAQLGFKPKSKGQSGAGLIQGPGTGTSDDIQKDIPVGSFIMPADSTQSIGADVLAGMGSAVPANVSNGEFAMPPEQVHAVGVQALNQMRDQTHTPTGQPQVQGSADRPDLFFADGGEVEDPRRRTSQSRALVPVSQPAAASATAPQASAQPNPGTMYTNSSGQTGRGFMPSSSRAVVPAGPVTTHQPGRSLVPAGPVVDQPRPEGIDPRTQERVRSRVQADTANWQQHRASQDARFAAAGSQSDSAGSRFRAAANRARGFSPKGSGIFGAASSALPEALDVYDVATDPNTTGLDVATQASEGIGRTAATAAGAAGGAKAGAVIGAFGGPAAPLTVPLATGAGALIGGGLGYWGAGKAIEMGREALGASTESPIDRVDRARPAPPPAAEPAVPYQPAASASQQEAPAPEAGVVAPQLENNVIRDGNSFHASGPITQGFTVNGQNPATMVNTVRSPQNEAAVQALMARTPELGAPRGFAPGQRDVLQDQLDRLESSNPNYLTIVRDSTEGGMRGFMNRQLNERDAQQRAERAEQRQQQITDLRRDIDSREYARGRDAVADERTDLADSIAARQADLQLSQGERLDALYRDYEAATSENERARLAERIRVLSGNAGSGENLRNYYLPVGGGQEFDLASGMLRNVPQRLIDLRTGQEVGGSQSQAPQPGEQRGGYRFKGGNPADQKNWEKI